jgi:hypothetical protein
MHPGFDDCYSHFFSSVQVGVLIYTYQNPSKADSAFTDLTSRSWGHAGVQARVYANKSYLFQLKGAKLPKLDTYDIRMKPNYLNPDNGINVRGRNQL